MINIIGRRKIWYALSALLILPGVLSLAVNGLKLGIDFTGGSLMEVEGRLTQEQVSGHTSQLKLDNLTITPSGENRTLIRFRDPAEDPTVKEANHQTLKHSLETAGSPEVRFDSVGPSVSRDITRNALVAVAAVSLAVVLYVAFVFRNSPPPVKPISFGLATVVALVHDALFLIGLFSILGWLLGIEVDALFVTSVLTVIGFSVHDTIVVFDRVRENLRREKKAFDQIVNDSILQTMTRSLNTSITVLLVLMSLYLFGGESIKTFVLSLFVGIAVGTFSSIFVASPLLVTYHNWQTKRAKSSK